MKDFVDETKPTCFGSNHTTRQTVLYISNFLTNTYEPLRELSDIGGNCAVLMVAFFIHLDEEKNNSLAFFDWLPFHRLIVYTMGTWPFQIRELLPSHIELFKLINNPNFNRFQFYEKTLVPDFQFSDILRNNNSTKWLFIRIDWHIFGYFLDLDTILQLLNILKQKLEGMPFRYSVIFPGWRMANSKVVQKIIVDKLRIEMFLPHSVLEEWFQLFIRSLALTITRRDSRLPRFPGKEIDVLFNDQCQHNTTEFRNGSGIVLKLMYCLMINVNTMPLPFLNSVVSLLLFNINVTQIFCKKIMYEVYFSQ